jgi:hypothetical protein
MVHGIHQGFGVLGALTIVSAVVFVGLRKNDGSAVSRHVQQQPEAGRVEAHLLE